MKIRKSFLDSLIRREVRRALVSRRRHSDRYFRDEALSSSGLSKLQTRYFKGVQRNAKFMAEVINSELIVGQTRDQLLDMIARINKMAKAIQADLARATKDIKAP